MTAPRWKIVTFQEAKTSGRAFRASLPNGQPTAHFRETGHLWYRLVDAVTAPDCIPKVAVECTACKRLFAMAKDRPNTWIIVRSEDELMQDAEAVLNYLGLKIDKEGRYDESRYDRS